MRYRIFESRRYRKSYSKISSSKSFTKKRREELEIVIDTLSSVRVLDEKYKDHQLKGKLKDFRECHIGFDLLLVYKKSKQELVLVLVDIGTHPELFGA